MTEGKNLTQICRGVENGLGLICQTPSLPAAQLRIWMGFYGVRLSAASNAIIPLGYVWDGNNIW